MKKKILFIIVAVILLVVAIFFCKKFFFQEKDSSDWISYEELTKEQKQNLHYLFGAETETKCNPISKNDPLLNDPESYAGYSYSETYAYKEGEIKYGPESHIDEVKKTISREEIIEIAKKEADLDYEEILVAKDQTAKKWRITFWTKENNQKVYLYEDGSINLVTNIMKND